MANWQRVGPGSTFPGPLGSAAVVNAMLDAANMAQRTALGDARHQTHRGTRDGTIVKVKNSTGDALRMGEVVELSDFVLLDSYVTQKVWWFAGSVPDLTHVGFAVCQEPIPDDKIGVGSVAGMAFGLVNFSDADHQFAKVESGQDVLQSAASGPVQILYAAGSGTGERECAILLTPKVQASAVRIQIWKGGDYDNEGDLLEPDEDGYHPGRLITHVGDDVEVGDTVKVHVMDWHDSDQGEGPGAIVENGRFYMGLLEGTQGGTPRVTIELGHVTYTGQPEDDIAKGGSGVVRLYNGDETDSGLTVTAKALGMGVFEDNWVQVSRWAGGAWYVGCWEF